MRNKICVIGPALKMGGMERASVNIANSIHMAGNNVIFISLFKSEHFFKLNEGVKLYEPSGFNVRKINIIRTILWLRRTVDLIQPDTILVFNKFYGAISILALLFTKYRIFISERSSPFYVWDKKLTFFNGLIYKFRAPDGVIAQTQIAAHYQKKYYKEGTRIRVIPNAVREVKLYPEVKRKNWVLAVGRFGDHLKGFDRLIDAFAKVKDLDWRLIFAGGDEDGQYLKDRASNLGVLNRIQFLGKVSDIDRVYAEAGIFVIPSRSEGFPNALCEAMAAGLPCISFKFTAGPAEIITNNVDGLLVNDGDTDAMAEHLEILMKNRELRSLLGKNALRVRERYKQETISREVISFITKI